MQENLFLEEELPVKLKPAQEFDMSKFKTELLESDVFDLVKNHSLYGVSILEYFRQNKGMGIGAKMPVPYLDSYVFLDFMSHRQDKLIEAYGGPERDMMTENTTSIFYLRTTQDVIPENTYAWASDTAITLINLGVPCIPGTRTFIKGGAVRDLCNEREFIVGIQYMETTALQ